MRRNTIEFKVGSRTHRGIVRDVLPHGLIRVVLPNASVHVIRHTQIVRIEPPVLRLVK